MAHKPKQDDTDFEIRFYESLLEKKPDFIEALAALGDLYTHKGFYETPFLFPISNYKFDQGISWGHPTFMLINYACLAIVYVIIFFFIRRNRIKQS